MTYITHVRLEAERPPEHQHITDIQWLGPSALAANQSSLGQVVDWINDGGDAWVRDGFANYKVVVVIGAPRHIRTVAHDTFTDISSSFPVLKCETTGLEMTCLQMKRQAGRRLPLNYAASSHSRPDC
jgi:hypothetical protein